MPPNKQGYWTSENLLVTRFIVNPWVTHESRRVAEGIGISFIWVSLLSAAHPMPGLLWWDSGASFQSGPWCPLAPPACVMSTFWKPWLDHKPALSSSLVRRRQPVSLAQTEQLSHSSIVVRAKLTGESFLKSLNWILMLVLGAIHGAGFHQRFKRMLASEWLREDLSCVWLRQKQGLIRSWHLQAWKGKGDKYVCVTSSSPSYQHP